MEKINVFGIFSAHFKTLRHFSKGRISFSDIALFYIGPLVAAMVLAAYLPRTFLNDVSTEVITFYSVFGGFMLNLLVLIYGFDVNKFKNPEIAETVLKEITANISYLVTTASLTVLVLFVVKLCGFIGSPVVYVVQGFDVIHFLSQVGIVLVVGSLLNFILTILMVLRRFYALDHNQDSGK